MIDYSDGKKSIYHKWYHDLRYPLCLIYGHNTYCGWDNDTQVSFDHCRRCERYNTERTMKSFNLWAKIVLFEVNVSIWKGRHGL